MEEGLDITEKQFMKLPTKEQNGIIFKNLKEIKIAVKSYKFQQKMQYIWLGILTIVTGVKAYLGGFE